MSRIYPVVVIVIGIAFSVRTMLFMFTAAPGKRVMDGTVLLLFVIELPAVI
jgi:hypothetical protein